MEVSGQLYAPAALPPGIVPATHWVGSEVSPRAGLNACTAGNETQAVAIPTLVQLGSGSKGNIRYEWAGHNGYASFMVGSV
jgi:hypothetical protein